MKITIELEVDFDIKPWVESKQYVEQKTVCRLPAIRCFDIISEATIAINNEIKRSLC